MSTVARPSPRHNTRGREVTDRGEPILEVEDLEVKFFTRRGVVQAVRDVTFTFAGRNRFTRATREVATREALRARGLDRDQVRAILRRTIATVADSDLTEEQWLTIALRYTNESAS